MSPEETLSQIRQAHRLCIAFYQRVMPLIEHVAAELELNFVRWAPRTFDRPVQRATNPFTSWSWDYLPLINAGFVFSSQENEGEIRTTDYILDIELVVDSEIDSASFADRYGKAQPDATRLLTRSQEADSFLKIYLFQADRPLAGNAFEVLWSNYVGYPALNGITETGIPTVKAVGFTLPLSEVMNENGVGLMVERIRDRLQSL